VERVARAVRTLDEPYRTAILLRYFEDLPPPAIAARLGAPLETVRTRLRRGLALLRERLDRDHRGDRRRWSLLLLPLARRPEPAAAGPALAAGAAGAILVTLKTKAAVAAVLVLVAAGSTIRLAAPGPDADSSRGDAPGPVAAAVGIASAPSSASAPAPVPPDESARGESVATPASAPDVCVTGLVVDGETGAPVGGARVVLVYGRVLGDAEAEPSATTDADGRFRIEEIGDRRLGTDALLVRAEGYAEAMHSVYGWRTRLRPGEPLDLGEFRLERGARVAGRVIDADGRAVPGATLLFCRDTPLTIPASFAPNHAREAAVADAEGRFALERVPSAKGPTLPHTLFALSGDRFGWRMLPPVAGRKDLDGFDVRLAPTAAAEVTVLGPDGRPIEGATVVAEPHFPPLGAEPRQRAAHDLWVRDPRLQAIFVGRSDATGRLRFDRLPVDGDSCVYDFVASAGGMDRGWRDDARVAPGATVPVEIQLAAATESSLSGSIRGRDGAPIAGAEVNFVGRRAKSDAEGNYRVDGVRAADMNFDPWVVVEAAGFANAARVFRRPERWDRGGVDFVLDPAVPLKGVVADEEGRPVQGTQVTLMVADVGVETVHSGPDGRFEMRAAAGREARLSVHPPEPFADWLAPDVPPIPADGSEVRVVLRRAPPGTRVVVEVRDAATGRPLDPTRVELHLVDWRNSPRHYGVPPRIESGRAVFERVLPGAWIAWVSAPGSAPARREFRVEPGAAETSVTVPCAPTGTVRGRLEGAGRLERRGMVFLSLVGVESLPQWVELESAPDLINAANVETDGSFRVEGAPPGPMRIRTEFPGFRGETEVEVLPGAEVEAVIRLQAMGRASFRPAGPPPGPVVEVRFAPVDGAWGRWTSFHGRDGRIPEWTPNVPPGRVRWEARFREKYTESASDAAAFASGVFEVKAGETVEVPIPVR